MNLDVASQVCEHIGYAAPFVRKALMAADKPRRGIQSIEIGTGLLLQLAKKGVPLPLRDIARGAGITIGKAHPYLVSFCKVGFVTQDAAGYYELGPLALQLGLVRLQRLDAVKEATPLVEALALETGLSIAVAVWGNLGPTVVRLEQPSQPLHIAVRVGTVMSVANTATGRLFAAYLSHGDVAPLMSHAVASYGGLPEDTARAPAEDMPEILAQIRSRGVSRTLGRPIPGVNALAAPVFDSTGNLVLAVTAMGPAAVFDASWDGMVVTALCKCAAEISSRLGFRATVPAADDVAAPTALKQATKRKAN